eukprot:7443128-Alexandrium_andersonii.AAC.1
MGATPMLRPHKGHRCWTSVSWLALQKVTVTGKAVRSPNAPTSGSAAVGSSLSLAFSPSSSIGRVRASPRAPR